MLIADTVTAAAELAAVSRALVSAPRIRALAQTALSMFDDGQQRALAVNAGAGTSLWANLQRPRHLEPMGKGRARADTRSPPRIVQSETPDMYQPIPQLPIPPETAGGEVPHSLVLHWRGDADFTQHSKHALNLSNYTLETAVALRDIAGSASLLRILVLGERADSRCIPAPSSTTPRTQPHQHLPTHTASASSFRLLASPPSSTPTPPRTGDVNARQLRALRSRLSAALAAVGSMANLDLHSKETLLALANLSDWCAPYHDLSHPIMVACLRSIISPFLSCSGGPTLVTPTMYTAWLTWRLV